MDDLDDYIEGRNERSPGFADLIKEKRYQYQPWYIKLWRRRHYLRIPFMAFRIWIGSKERFDVCWSLSTGLVQGDMKWYYTWEETKERLNEKLKRRKS